METKDYITIVIGGFVALLGAITFWRQFRKDKRQVLVTHEPTFLAYADGSISTQMTSIKVINKGVRAIVVSAPTVRVFIFRKCD